MLAVDDSAVMRGLLRNLFQAQGKKRSSDLPEMELCGVVEDGAECLDWRCFTYAPTWWCWTWRCRGCMGWMCWNGCVWKSRGFR